MTAIVKNKFRLTNAKNFKNTFNNSTDVSTLVDNYYMFVGKSLPWSLDEYPDTPVDTLDSNNDIWDNMLSLKRITDASVSLCIPRKDWISGKVYTQYNSNDGELTEHPTNTNDNESWYVLNSDFDLFVCICNNNNALSTVKPEYSSASPLITTSDGYIWQYLTSLTTLQINNFLSNNWIPVKNTPNTDDLESNYDRRISAKQYASQHPGSILSATVTNNGSQYYNVIVDGTAHTTAANTITTDTYVLGTLSSTTAQNFVGSTLYIKNKKYSIASCLLINNQYVFTTQEQIGATEIITPSAFSVGPNLNISGDGGEVLCIPKISNGQLVSVQVVSDSQNKNYTYAECTVISGGTGGIGAQVKINIAPKLGLGYDIESDLNAYFVMCRTALNYGVEDFPISNDYRQIGILHNAIDSSATGGDVLLTSNTACATKIITFEITGLNSYNDYEKAFLPDELISASNGAAGYVVDYSYEGSSTSEGTTVYIGKLSYFQNKSSGKKFDFSLNQTITSASGSTAVITNITPSEIVHNKGDILYIENRRPILRSPDQIEEIKTIIEF